MNGRVTSRGAGEYHAGEGHIALLSRLHKPNTARGVIYCHSYGGDHAQAVDGIETEAVLSTLAVAGHPVLSCDMGGPSTWGNDTAQSRLSEARAFLISRYGVTDTSVHLVAVSMGALVALNWARANASLVASVSLCVPVVDLADVHDNDRSGLAAPIEAAYGGGAGYSAAVDAHNPAANVGGYAGMPIRAWTSETDTIALAAKAESFASAVASRASVDTLGAIGHAVTGWSAAEVLSFVELFD